MTEGRLLGVLLVVVAVFFTAFGLVVLQDVLTYRDLQRRLRREREERRPPG